MGVPSRHGRFLRNLECQKVKMSICKDLFSIGMYLNVRILNVRKGKMTVECQTEYVRSKKSARQDKNQAQSSRILSIIPIWGPQLYFRGNIHL